MLVFHSTEVPVSIVPVYLFLQDCPDLSATQSEAPHHISHVSHSRTVQPGQEPDGHPERGPREPGQTADLRSLQTGTVTIWFLTWVAIVFSPTDLCSQLLFRMLVHFPHPTGYKHALFFEFSSLSFPPMYFSLSHPLFPGNSGTL